MKRKKKKEQTMKTVEYYIDKIQRGEKRNPITTDDIKALVELWRGVMKSTIISEDVVMVRGFILERMVYAEPEKMDRYFSDFYTDEELIDMLLERNELDEPRD